MKLILIFGSVAVFGQEQNVSEDDIDILTSLVEADLADLLAEVNLPSLGAPEGRFNPEADLERYFFTQAPAPITTQPPTQPPTTQPTYGESCWKCDQMTYEDCAAHGRYDECSLGEKNSCFFEVREKEGELDQLCMGCKATEACLALKRDNFHDVNFPHISDQCRPNYERQNTRGREGVRQSVCRTCAQSCNPHEFGGAFCFGSIKDDGVDMGNVFMLPFDTHYEEYPGLYSFDMPALGIPTFAFIDASRDAAATSQVEDFTLPNVYFNNPTNGKVAPTVGNNIRELEEMTYWSLQGADRFWWDTDLINLQDVYARAITDGCNPSPVLDETYTLSDCPNFAWP